VANLERSLDFYRERIGLQVQRREGNGATLGVGGADLLQLAERRGRRKALGAADLYHFALLLPSRRHLALTLRHLAETETTLAGMADHAVSEAIYLSDPDGHGIEIYRDRPRDEWPYENGRLQMTTDPLQTAPLFDMVRDDEQPWRGLPPGTVMGHIHLHVSDLAAAERFYRDGLGLDLVVRYGRGASFLSADGYHHHVGINTWAGAGAPPPPPEALKLEWFHLHVAEARWQPLLDRLDGQNVTTTAVADGLQVTDPTGHTLRLIRD
jgi:catechol 2,3-dioxygenase